ncbi:DUF6367 family protein [Burkholderia sp. PAMC 26561]|uniref:DUF6367 family protein n=1 Tax=Burkholderia sp. PAMC 26561 TaxID=1795043 RepID=UPI00076B420C|nr:DUF6367 family protein [Burkholderia sp. PAMC 26561]AME26335.1 hypothetical protein AXG89_20835 [Burkholderia sp. PAMC 26561]
MKLNEIGIGDPVDIEEIWVTVSKDVLNMYSVVLESIWQPSARSGWSYRIDPEDPNLPLQRHIHIAKDKHTSSKKMQASWNVDGSRHDRKTFNVSIGSQNFVRDLARSALKLRPSIVLEHLADPSKSIVDRDIALAKDGKVGFIELSLD